MKFLSKAAPVVVKPQTFTEATAPLKKIAMDIIWVEGNCIERALNAEKEIVAAQLYADTVREMQTEIVKTAREEGEQAAKTVKALIALLGEETA